MLLFSYWLQVYNGVMSTLFPDTRPEAEEVLIHLLREAPPWRKLEMVAQMNATVRKLNLIGMQKHYPNDPPQKIRRRLADLWLGEELAMKVYGPLEDVPDEC